MTQGLVHYGLHVLLPLFIALKFYPKRVIIAYAIMMAGMLIDLDHLLATPIFDSNRCSINFHPLHTYWAMAIYIVLLFPKQTRLIALGLICHIIADIADCLLM
ncbi:DUF6122 family protein [Hanstruepera flava]|uniref:DUF6122 family protein n=1 Tax=Hanstruepera flava TaxID=2930218 RepID=UPI002028538C|nr:DUF6122 family protein [Hanstruepera flava]